MSFLARSTSITCSARSFSSRSNSSRSNASSSASTPPAPGSGDRTGIHPASLLLYNHFRGTSDHFKLSIIEIIQIRGWILVPGALYTAQIRFCFVSIVHLWESLRSGKYRPSRIYCLIFSTFSQYCSKVSDWLTITPSCVKFLSGICPAFFLPPQSVLLLLLMLSFFRLPNLLQESLRSVSLPHDPPG